MAAISADVPEVGNGVRTSGLLVNGQGAAFLAQLDSAAPPAPPTG